MRNWKTLALCLVAAGCGRTIDVDRSSQTQFVPSTDHTSFTFTGQARAQSEDDERNEAALRQWLDDWVKEAKMCPNGYTIDTLDRIKTFTEADGGAYRVTMIGRCK
jgi:hypothetical protein